MYVSLASAINFKGQSSQFRENTRSSHLFHLLRDSEISGEIVAVGEGVTGWQQGDRVLGSPGEAGFAEQTIVDASRIFRIPSGMNWAQAAALPIVYRRSYFALKDWAELRAGEWLLAQVRAAWACRRSSWGEHSARA
jgi:NADPH:quinone reductase-like Zn-dependent oxidoreductase